MQVHLNCRNKIFLPLTYHHSHFLAATWISHLFLTGGCTLFLQLSCFGSDKGNCSIRVSLSRTCYTELDFVL